jgi:hypothetical protein
MLSFFFFLWYATLASQLLVVSKWTKNLSGIFQNCYQILRISTSVAKRVTKFASISGARPVKVPWELSPTVVGQARPWNVEVDADARVEGMKGAGEHLQRPYHPRYGRLQGGQVRPRHPHKDVVPRD